MLKILFKLITCFLLVTILTSLSLETEASGEINIARIVWSENSQGYGDLDPPPNIILASTSGNKSSSSISGNLNIDLGNFVNNLPLDNEKGNASNLPSLFQLKNNDNLIASFTNLPPEGTLTMSSGEFIPSFLIKYKDNILNVPKEKEIDSATKHKLDDSWKKYKDENIKTDVFIYKVEDIDTVPNSKSAFFNLPNDKFIFKTTITDKTTDLSKMKITQSGYYVLGLKITKGSETNIEVVPLRVTLTESFGYLPLVENSAFQINDSMIISPLTKAKHDLTNIKFPGYQSFKVISAQDDKTGSIAIGSLNGGGITIFDKALNKINLATSTISSSDKVKSIKPYLNGFLIATEDSLHYVDLLESKSLKVQNLLASDIKEMTIFNNSIYLIKDGEFVVGDLSITKSPDNKINSILFTTVNPDTHSLTEIDIFGTTSSISTLELFSDYVILTGKNGSGKATVKLVAKK